jgi:glycosyltransferase involved in cell wall biosynthesis
VKVTQVLCAAGPVDAVTNQALSWRARFSSWGWEGEDFTAKAPIDWRRHGLKPLRELERPDGIVLLHYSGYARGLERLFEGSARTLLLSHNVTPEEWFWPYEPVEGVRCKLGREQLHELAVQVDRLAGVSDFNARELREASGRPADVIPVLFDASHLGAAADPGEPDRRSGPTVLFVGRLAPHKRQDLVIRAFAEYRQSESTARLVLVGNPLSPAYGQQLAELARELAGDSVSFESGLTPQQLGDRYRGADVFLCLSEHEGFCIPLLEAFHFRLPVVARDAAAVGEVVGDAGVLLGFDDGVATVAQLLRIMTSDAELRDELVSRGERRLRLYDQATTASAMRAVLEEMAGS